MKKIVKILGVAVIAMSMFFSANTLNNSNGNFDLTSLLTMSTANAEHGDQDSCDPESIQDRYADTDPCYTGPPWEPTPGTLVECHTISSDCCIPYSCA